MKKLSLILNVILLILVAVLFYLHFSTKQNSTRPQDGNTVVSSPITSHLSIAYVNIDSLEAHYGYFKQKQAELSKEQQSIQNDLSGRARTLQNEVAQLQKKATTMTQAEGEAAQQSIMQKQQALQQREQDLRQRFLQDQQNFNIDLHNRLSAYLKKYNEHKHYTYILSYSEMASDILLKDTAFDITEDVIKGLNAEGEK